MSLPNLYVLDVGHGNSTVIETHAGCAVFDAGQRTQLIDFLRKKSITKIEYVVLSHADADHIGGLIAILSDDKLSIDKVYLNPNSSKSTKTWNSLLFALNESKKSSRLNQIIPHASSNLEDSLSLGDLKVNILAPNEVSVLRGTKSKLSGRNSLSTNGLSVVAKIVFQNDKAVLLTGDIDLVGLREMLKGSPNLDADYLVFPHHGGLPDRQNVVAFVNLLHSSISFKHVIFSIRQNRNSFPRIEVLNAISDIDSDIRFITTQRSESVAKLNQSGIHKNGVGTIRLSPDKQEIVLDSV